MKRVVLVLLFFVIAKSNMAVNVDSVFRDSQIRGLTVQKDSLVQALEVLKEETRSYKAINEGYYDLIEEKHHQWMWFFGLFGVLGVGGILGLIKYVKETVHKEAARQVGISKEAFERIIKIYGAHDHFMQRKVIWVVEQNSDSIQAKSITRLLRKIGFLKVYQVFPDALMECNSEKPDMILFNNEEKGLVNSVDELNQFKKDWTDFREKKNPDAIIFWFDDNDIKLLEVGKSNFANSRYTLFNNIIESFRIQDVKL